MKTWSQEILNGTLASIHNRHGWFNFEVTSSSIDVAESRIRLVFEERPHNYGDWLESAPLSLDKWVQAHQSALESGEVGSAVAGMWMDVATGVGEVFTREHGDLTFELERWFMTGPWATWRLSIQSRNPRSLSPDDCYAVGETVKWLLSTALQGVEELLSRDFKIVVARLDGDGTLRISVRSEELGAERLRSEVVVTDDFKPDEAAQTFIEQNKASLESCHDALPRQLRQVLTEGSGGTTRLLSPSARMWTEVKLEDREGDKTDFEISFAPSASE